MKNLAPTCATIALALLATHCASYSGVSKSPDGALWISGATNFFVFSQPWIRRCEVDGMKLNCVELSESPQAAPRSMGGSTTPAPTSEPATAAPAPAPEPAPTKKK